MLYEDGIRIGATILTILLPTVTAYFAFRSAERKINADKDKVASVISYEEPMSQIANASTEILKIQQKTADREFEWQQAILRELHSISLSLRS